MTHSHNLHIIKSPAREHLRVAIEAVETAELAHAKSIEAEARASNMMAAAETEVRSFDHLDASIASHHAGNFASQS
jgi:hypothetical protein